MYLKMFTVCENWVCYNEVIVYGYLSNNVNTAYNLITVSAKFKIHYSVIAV